MSAPDKAGEIQYKFSACAVFADSKESATELRTILVDARGIDEALSKADTMMKHYAIDFGFTYSGNISVHEYGSDMLEEYGEVFSTVWKTDKAFDNMLEMKITEDEEL